MSRRITRLPNLRRDGTSQRGRVMPALDPGYARVDERTDADLIRFVQAFTEHLRNFAPDGEQVVEAGTWREFASHPELTAEDIAARIDDPSRYTGEHAAWLARPHLALLLVFVAAMRHVRDQQNDLTRRHLEHYYRDVLRMEPLPAEPDRVAVAFRLANRVAEQLVPAGTALVAGRDAEGVERIYRTERDILVNRATVSELRSVYVDRRRVGIRDARRDASLTAAGAFDLALRIALGTPDAGDPIPPFRGTVVDTPFVAGLRKTLRFCRESLFLDHHELRSLLQRVRRREAADGEWAELNRLMKVVNPADPRDFAANLASVVGPLDFKDDGLPKVGSVDDLYTYRDDPAVRDYIVRRLGKIGYDDFVAMMAIKLRIDAEWAEVVRLVERAGRRQRGVLVWTLGGADPTAFDRNFRKALGARWPTAWPGGSDSVRTYDVLLRDLEAHLHLPVERIERLVTFAESLGTGTDAKAFDWSDVDPILTDAHAEMAYAGRRAKLAAVRGPDDSLTGFDRVATWVLGSDSLERILPWEETRPALAAVLDPGSTSLLDAWRDQRTTPGAVQILDWSDVYRVLELAQRYTRPFTAPDASLVQWRNLYSWPDATRSRVESGRSPRWNTFGALPATLEAPAPNVGFAIRSSLLSLSQGVRTITLTLGFSPDGFDRDDLLADLGLDPALYTDAAWAKLLGDTFVVQASTAKGWLDVPIAGATLSTDGPSKTDYWTLTGLRRPTDQERPAIQLQLGVDVTQDALAPLPGEETPILRLLLRPSWDEQKRQWVTAFGALEVLRLASVHVGVNVEGLVDLRLQHEDRALDPRRPIELFGARPAAGATLYVSHPELVRNRLEKLSFSLAWMGLPESLATHYENYPGVAGGTSFRVDLALLDRGLALPLGEQPLFAADVKKVTPATHTVVVGSVAGTIAEKNPAFTYARRPRTTGTRDLRADERTLRWQLRAPDFGHSIYPTLSAQKARELAIDVANGPAKEQSAYRVEAPYTPTLASISVSYSTSTEILPGREADELLHAHPFGEARITEKEPWLLPRYDLAGELYVGLTDFEPPRHLSLLFQLAEGTSDPDLEPSPVTWSALDGDEWRPLAVLHDSTRGLLNTGVVELEIPALAPSRRLPAGRTWLRVGIARDASSVCDTVDVRAQAVFAVFEDRGNAAAHYEEPLPPGSISRLVEPEARIAAVEQPYTSFGGRAAEASERFYVRVSERLRHKQRALAPSDYERLVLQRFPEVFKARCLRSDGGGRVDVLVIPDIQDALPGDAFAPKVSADLLADITAYLTRLAPAAATIRVRNPRYVAVRVRLGVRFRAGVDETFAARRLNEDLVRFLSPWAFEEGAEITIGGSIYGASIVDFVDRRPYVDYVAELKLFRGRGDDDYDLVPYTPDYGITAERPDEVLVAAPEHDIYVISELGYDQKSFVGIGYMKVQLDFIVGG